MDDLDNCQSKINGVPVVEVQDVVLGSGRLWQDYESVAGDSRLNGLETGVEFCRR
jgi:hypothetical protein